MKYSKFIKSSLEKASQIAIKKFGKVSGSVKRGDDNQILTEADIQIGKLFLDLIHQEFPQHNIIDEELGTIDNNSQFTWIIDPIDGTSNFARGIPNYGIMVCLLDREQPISAGISLPSFQELILTDKGEGSYDKSGKLSVTKNKNLLHELVAYQLDAHRNNPDITIKECAEIAKIALEVRNLRTSGSCFDGVMVAKGKYGACLNQTAKIWDVVAQHLIVKEAGGICTDFFGKDLDYTDPLKQSDRNFTYCLTTPSLYKPLQKIIANFTKTA